MTAVTVHREAPGLPVPRANLVDRAIEYFSPAVAARRLQGRVALAVASQYLGGQYQGARTDRRALQDWIPRAGSGAQDTIGDLQNLRARSRDLERNEPLATGAIGSQLTAVLGPGLIPYPQIDAALLGLSEADADAWEEQAARLWRAHAGSQAIDFAGTATIDELSEQVLFGWLTSGDILAVRRYVDRPDRLFGLAIQLIEADRVCSPSARDVAGRMMAGVEVDSLTGAPVAYHVANAYPGDRWSPAPTSWSRIPRIGADGAPQALLVYSARRPELLRGVPFLAPVIEPLKQLGRYSEAELAAAVIAAFFTVFVKRKTVAGDDAVPMWQSGMTEDATASNPTSSTADLKLGPAAIAELADDEDISIANPGRPNAQFDPYWQAMVRQIGVALEIPFEVLIKHFTASYSASRGAMIEAWRVFLTRRARLVRSWYRPVWEWVITEAVARGYLAAPGFFEDPLRRAAWLGVEWAGPTMPQLDPAKEATAAGLRLDRYLTSLEEESTALTGTAWSRKFNQIKKERRALAEAGLALPTTVVTAPSPAEEDA